jgi:predicted RNase H-like nuclease
LKVIGVDGCPGGWIAMVYDVTANTLTPRVHSTFAGLVDTYPEAEAIAVDIPIGLAEGVPRMCDLEARKVLGPRRSSVFPAPDPRFLTIPVYADALNRSRAVAGKGISRQAFAIYPKVAEVNEVISPFTQDRIFEVHPEVCFWAMNGRQPMEYWKRKPEGFEERHALLASVMKGISIPDRREAGQLARPAAADDILDAIAAAWTARRHAEGLSGRLPDMPSTDAFGLRMEIVY